MNRYLVAASLVLVGTAAQAQDNGGLKTAISVDSLAGFPLNKSSESLDKLELRGVEATFYAPIDQQFDGVVSIAAHPEGNQTFGTFEVHEAYFGSTKLVPNSRFKLGQFFLGIGRLNQFHQHDWPFVSTPLAQEAFIATEGAVDTGVEWSTLLPTDAYFDVTVGYTNGRTFGHSHEEEDRPRVNTHYTHIVNYSEPFAIPTQLGFTYLGRTSESGQKTLLLGLDLTSKVKEANYQRWLWQSELWYRELTFEDKARSFAGYSFLSYGFDVNWSVGLRLDYLTVLSSRKLDGTKAENQDYAGELHVGYRSSEFANFKLAYHRKEEHRESLAMKANDEVLFQSVFILGAHPSHDF